MCEVFLLNGDLVVKSLKISDETHRLLRRVQGLLQFETGRKWSLDRTVRELCRRAYFELKGVVVSEGGGGGGGEGG